MAIFAMDGSPEAVPVPTHVDVQHVMTQDLSLHSVRDFKRVDPAPLRLVGRVARVVTHFEKAVVGQIFMNAN
jgi:hypothetical protein